MDEDEPKNTLPEDDSLLREVAAAPAVPIPQDFATLVLLEPGTVVDGAFGSRPGWAPAGWASCTRRAISGSIGRSRSS